MTKAQAQAKARAEGREIIEDPDGTWMALPTATERERTRKGCTCDSPQDGHGRRGKSARRGGLCDMCGYRIGGSPDYATPREAREIFVASDGDVRDYE